MITALLVLVAIVGTLAYTIVARRRHTGHLDLDLDGLTPLSRGLPQLTGLTGSSCYDGNAAIVLQNGRLFDAFEDDIAGAQHTIHLETFVWTKGALEKRMVDLLCGAAARNVVVRVLIDGVGGSGADSHALDRLRQAGVELTIYRPPRKWNLRRLNHRTHRKLLIVDGRIGYTFGHGIADQWLGDALDAQQWRDTGVRLEGPVVHGLQAIFIGHWIEETRRIPTEKGCFPELVAQGACAAHVVSSDAGEIISSVSLLYTLCIASAKKEILIQNPYFVPGAAVVELLKKMAARDVTVRLMVPGSHTDNAIVRHAGCYLYEGLLKAGVHVYEYDRSLCHQKVVVVDGVWSHIGSTNFDARSLALNEEAGVGILDAGVAEALRQAFESDLRFARKLELATWNRRGLGRRCLEWLLYRLHEQL
jgi:cardiolipin synthase